jgi:hypothetical protein
VTDSWRDGGEYYFIQGLNAAFFAVFLISSILTTVGIAGFDSRFAQSLGIVFLPIPVILLLLILDVLHCSRRDCEDCDWFNHDEGYCSIDGATSLCSDFSKVAEK